MGEEDEMERKSEWKKEGRERCRKRARKCVFLFTNQSPLRDSAPSARPAPTASITHMRPSYSLPARHLPLQDCSSPVPLMSRFRFLLSACPFNIFIGLTILLLLLRLLNKRVIIRSTSVDVPGDSHHFSREEDDEPPGSLTPPHC